MHVKEKFEIIGTHAIQSIFGQQYEFKLEEVKTKENTFKGLNPVVKGPSGIFDSLTDTFGDGAIDTLNTCFNMLLHHLVRKTGPIIIFDEPVATLDKVKWESFCDLLCELAIELNLQIIMITHSNFRIGNLIQITNENGISEIHQ